MRKALSFSFSALILISVLVSCSQSSSIKWAKGSYRNILKEASKKNKNVFIDFYAVWCGPCKMLERTTYRNPDVISLLNSIIPLKVDAERGEGKRLAKKFRIKAFPTLILLDPGGKEITRYIGYMNAYNFLKVMKHHLKRSRSATYHDKKTER